MRKFNFYVLPAKN